MTKEMRAFKKVVKARKSAAQRKAHPKHMRNVPKMFLAMALKRLGV